MRIRNKIWYLVKYVSSLRFSISLFLILSSISIIGTIIEQDQSLSYYQLNYPDSNSAIFRLTWSRIIDLGLNHVYSTYWFLAVMLLFFLSLLVCTFSTQLPILKNARRWNFLYGQAAIKSKMCYSQIQYCSVLNFVFVLSLNNYCVFHKGRAIHAYKGLTGKIAPIFVHFGIVFTLIGSVVGFTNGFMAQEIVPNGEVFHVQNFVKSGYFGSAPSNLQGRVDDFFLAFNRDNSVQQFFSDISLIDSQGSVSLKKSVSVNTPLKFNGVTFYQTDWRISAVRAQLGSSKQLVKTLKQSTSGTISSSSSWFCTLLLGKKHKIFVLIPGLNDELFIYDNQGYLVKTAHYGCQNVIYGVPIVFKDIMSSTGLQIKADPGINLAYFGFLALMISMTLSYVSYSQIWASKHARILHLSGDANRALLAFEDEMSAICKKYTYLFRCSR